MSGINLMLNESENFIIHRSRTILNHGLSSLFFAPARKLNVRFGKNQSFLMVYCTNGVFVMTECGFTLEVPDLDKTWVVQNYVLRD